MTFEEVLAGVIEALQREERISYRALQRRFDLDDASLEDVKLELIAARLQGLAEPDTVVISEATSRLIRGYFTLHDLGTHALRGLEAPVRVSRVLAESAAQSRLDAADPAGLTPMVGREAEVTILRERWTRCRDSSGQVVVVTGEAGIGKSRLVRVLAEHVADSHTPKLTMRCSPYHTNSAFYPVIEHLQRLLHWSRLPNADARLEALEASLEAAGLPAGEVLPLMAPLLSLPLPDRYPPLATSPQQRKQQTLEALLTWLLSPAMQQQALAIWEDLHWADPSTLELLALLLNQIPATRLLLVLTCRPEFQLGRPLCSHMVQLTLARMTHDQVEEMILRLTNGKPLPPEVLGQVVDKTDGIPLFVEELLKTVVESGVVHEDRERYVLTGQLSSMAIPATLQDALMARLDRLASVKSVAQLGAVLGREFSYALLRAIAPCDEATLKSALGQLMDAELLYRVDTSYVFKHALVQDAAYGSLLRSTRSQHHQRIAYVLETQFSETTESQPELLARHYTEAGMAAQAVPHWQRAAELASDRSAHLEAINHVTCGIEQLANLPASRERSEQGLRLHLSLGAALLVTKGHAAPEVERAYTRAYALCKEVGESPELGPALFGLWRFYQVGAQFRTALELGETMLRLAQRVDDTALSVLAHYALGFTRGCLGMLPAARAHFEEGIAKYSADQRRVPVFRTGQDPGVACRAYLAWTLWLQGFPGQAMARSREALALAHEIGHGFSIAFAQCWVATVCQLCRDVPAAGGYAQAAIEGASDQDFPLWVAHATPVRGWALTLQGYAEAGTAEVRRGIAAWRETGAVLLVPYFLTLLADAYGQNGDTTAALRELEVADMLMREHEECWWESEHCRLKGILLLQRGVPHGENAEEWFRRALDIARRHGAKSLELRAATSLARLWHQQGKHVAAYELLGPVYSWFTEGYATADLIEAKALLLDQFEQKIASRE
jgi:predicted ATPase